MQIRTGRQKAALFVRTSLQTAERPCYNTDMHIRFSPEAARREITPIDNLFFLTYMPDADGTFVKVYLYGLMQCYHPSLRDDVLSEALGVTEAQVRCAFVYWQAKGLVRILSDEPFEVEYLLAEQPAVTTATPIKYRAFLDSLHALLAPRTLELREIKAMYDCIELYGLDQATVLELASYCIEQKGKRVSTNYMLTVAQTWSEAGIVTPEQARAYLDAYRVKKHGASEVLRRWNKRRKPTQDEMDLYDRWQREWGFDAEAILAVCPQLVGVANPTFQILNDRLFEMKEQSATTAAAIEQRSEQQGSAREFCRMVFARLGKVEVPSKTDVAQIALFREKGVTKEAILAAADECANGERPFGLLKKILSDWANAGVKTEAQAIEALSKHRNKPTAGGKKNRAVTGYQQTAITKEDIQHMIVDLDQDL